MIPSTDEAYSSSDFLALANEEMQSYVVPLLMSVREEYFVWSEDITFSSSGRRRVSTRAIGTKLRDVLVSADSVDFYDIPRIEPEYAHEYESGATGTPVAFYMQGNHVYFVPSTSYVGSMRLKWFMRPGYLVLPTDTSVSVISAINTSTNTLTTSAAHNFTTSSTVDLVRSQPHFGTHQIDRALSAAAGSSLTTTTSLPSELVVGDYVVSAGNSPVPQIPVEFHALLAQRTAAKVLEAMGNPAAGNAFTIADRMEKRLLTTVADRTEGSPRIIVNRRGPGWGSRRVYRGD